MQLCLLALQNFEQYVLLEHLVQSVHMQYVLLEHLVQSVHMPCKRASNHSFDEDKALGVLE
jgi:hypothetical protein